MNLLRKIASLNLFLLSLVFFASCSGDEPAPAPIEEAKPPAVLGRSITKTTFPANGQNISIDDSVVITFLEKDHKTLMLEGKAYRAVIDMALIEDVTSVSSVSADSLTITITPTDMLLANHDYKVTVKGHWEEYGKIGWNTIVWDGTSLTEEKVVAFSTKPAPFLIDNENIEYQYPIANQYHFLKGEYGFGFVKLKRKQTSLFNQSGHEYKAIFSKLTNEKIETNLTYDSDKGLVRFNIPGNLENETIYKLSLVIRETGGASESVLYSFHFRTSKYNTFADKFSTLSFTGNVLSGLSVPWRAYYLKQPFNASSEKFDSFELGIKQASVVLVNENHVDQTYTIEYGSNLVRFEAIMEGNKWYDEQLYPLLYAPWTESSFKPTVSRDTSVLGYKPVRAMSMYNAGGGELTKEMIAANSAPAITVTGGSAILHSLSVVIWKDFIEIQNLAVQRYINLTVIPDREHNLIFSQMPIITQGEYKYRIKYTLPSGEVTSTILTSMNYQ